MKNCLNCAKPIENNQSVCNLCHTDQDAYKELQYLENLQKSKAQAKKLNEASPEYTGVFNDPHAYLFVLMLLILLLAAYMYFVLPLYIVISFLVICTILLFVLASFITY